MKNTNNIPLKYRLKILKRGAKRYERKLLGEERQIYRKYVAPEGYRAEKKALQLARKKNNDNKNVSFKVPRHFCALKDPNKVIAFLRNVRYSKRSKEVKSVFIDMSDIQEIDICAIVMLLSVTNDLTISRISISGNFPDDPKCKKIFENSGFLTHMKDINGNRFTALNDYNLIVKRGRETTENEIVGKAIKKAVKIITGKEEHYGPVYSIAQEMCNNAIEHAYKKNKHWLFCVAKDQDKIVFVLSDMGTGILKTLNRKYRKYIEPLYLKSNLDILNRAYERKYGSVTQDSNRNKGLPLIKRISDEKRVNNLKVITNDVYLDFENNEKSCLLKKSFKGTLYYWEIDKTCIERWKNKKEE